MPEEEKIKTKKGVYLPQSLLRWIRKQQLTDRALALITLLVFAGDQLSKFWVGRVFMLGESRPLLPGIFHLTYVRNPGGAFGLLAHKTSFFIVASLLVIFLIIFGGRYLKTHFFLSRLALALLLGGVLGNLGDRLRTGYVIDFLDFRFWPVFNFADVALVLGIFLLAAGFLDPDFLPPGHRE
ncbi:MAG: signal peptidase II [Firmicutes bacterium]|nr:signal peptidase II [Bacillota bacterium]